MRITHGKHGDMNDSTKGNFKDIEENKQIFEIKEKGKNKYYKGLYNGRKQEYQK